MNNARRTSVRYQTSRNISSIPSQRTHKAQSFVALSGKLNALKEEHAIVRGAVDGLMTILDARGVLVFLRVPFELLYSKHRDHSEALAQFEKRVHERTETLLAIFSAEPRRRIFETEGVFVIPLSWQGCTIGLLAFDRQGRRPAAGEEASLLLLCNQFTAIFGLKHQATEALKKTSTVARQEDIDSAVAVQQSLQPSIPASPVCGLAIATHTQSAEYIGGDYFDLILGDQNRMGIIIADVEGKGVPAALFGNMLRTTVHFLTRETPSTASVVRKINSILHKEAIASQKLFTLFYAAFSPSDKVMTYTGSGHVSPIVIREENDKPERLRADGTLLGIDPGQRFIERSVQLHTGDLVAFFTDGLTEHHNEAGQTFGEHRLVHLLQSHKSEAVENIVTALLAGLSQFTQLPPADDVTVILAKVL